MADRIKNYEINYNILSNAVEAAKGFGELLGYVEKLSGKDPSTNMARGLTKLNGELHQTANAVNRLKTAFSEIRPAIDLSGFKSQLGQMQRAVSEFAQQTRNIMRMAMSGTDKQFAKARGAMNGDIFDAASLRHFEEELRKIPQKISEAKKAVDQAKKRYEEISNTPITYPKGSTKEDQENIAKAAKAEKRAAEAILAERKKALKNLEDQQEDFRRQAFNLRSSLSPESIKRIPKEAVIPKGMQKAVDLIPKWEQEHEKARAAALAKRAQLSKTISEPIRVPKPSFYSIKSPFGGGGIDSYLREYDEAAKKYATTKSIAQQRIMGDAKTNFMAIGGFNETQFNEAYKQFQAYEKYKTAYSNWVRAGRPSGQAYNQTDEYANYRRSLKRLRAAYGAQRQMKAIQANAAAQAASAGSAMGGGSPLPPILGMPTQVIEQAFTGKLTLLPDIPAAKALIAAEQFSANLRLLPMISDLKTKLNAETFKVNVTPSIVKSKGGKTSGAASGAFATLQEEINTLQRSAKAPITVGTQLNREGLLGRAQSGYNTLQTLANRHPITYRLASDGSGGFSLNQALARLTQIAKTRPVPFRMVHDGSGGFSLNQALARLTEIAKLRPIPFRMIADGSGGFSLNQALARLQSLAAQRPITIKNIVGGTTGKSRPIYVDVKARTAPLVNSINKAIKSKTFNISAKLNTTNLTTRVPLLERLQKVWAELPRTGNRTYTVNLKTTGLENIARIERIIALVNSLPASRTKNYGANVVSNNVGGRSVQNTNPYGSNGVSGGRIYGGKNNDVYTRARAWAYPFTGNTSFGARTPAALDMMKGMGMMMGIGEAMNVIGSSFSDAVGYQNQMETAKAILRDNYKGTNFNKDYNDMVRVVRDVAMRTKFTAPEAADATRFMAMAGLDIPMIKSAIAPIADVAAISDTDLGLVADKMTNIMTEFKVPPSRMRNLADMMTKTFTSTNTDMMMLAESLQYAGPMAFASGQSLAETLAMIGIMGNSGIQASMAGTTMRMMLQNIYNPNDKQEAFMEKIGLQTRDANGKRRPLFDILKDVARATGSHDSKDVVRNLLSGKDTKNNIDTFDAASRLFRVTAAAGGASLLSNIDKVGNLVQQIKNASGNSEAVSLAKQSTVAGMWAQAKSAFTEAVVRVFEDTDMQQYIRKTLGGLIEYLKQPEFIKTIKDLFELIKGIGSVLATFVGWWVKLYQLFPTITKWVMIGQVFFTQIGYLINPFIQLTGILATLGGVLRGVWGIGGAATLASVARGGAAAAGAMRTSGAAGTVANAMLFGGLTAKDAISKHNSQLIKYEKLSSRLRNTAYGSAIPGAWWAMAYTNPERVAMRSRAAIRAEQAAERHRSEIRAIREMEAQNAALLLATRQRHKVERLSNTGLLTRAARQGRLSWGNLGRGMGAAFTAGYTSTALLQFFGRAWSALRGGLTSVILALSKGLGLLVNPITLAVGAIGALTTSIYLFVKKQKELTAEYNKSKKKNEELSGETAASIGHRNSQQIKSLKQKLGLPSFTGVLELSERQYAPGEFKVDPLMKNNANVSSYFKRTGAYDKGAQTKDYLQLIQDMSPILFGKRLDDKELKSKYWGVTDSQYFKNDVALAAVALAGANSPFAKRAAAPIISRLEKWALIKDRSASNEEWGRIMADAKSTAERYNPAGKGYADFRGKSFNDIAQMRTSQVANSLQYQQGIYQSLLEINDPDNPIYGTFATLHELKNLAERGTARVFELLGNIAGEINFTLPDGNGVQQMLNLQFQDGVITFERFQARLASLGIKVPNDVQAFYDMLASIYSGMRQTLINAGQDMSGGDYALGAGGGVAPGQKLTKNELNTYGAWAKDWALSNPNESKWVISKYGSVDNWIKSKSWVNTRRINEVVKWRQNMVTGTTNVPSTPAPVSKPVNKKSYKPTAYNSASLNSGFENTYSYNAPRPTQVIVNIDKLMDAKMSIAANADERQLMAAMQDEIGRALGILSDGIVKDLQRSNYDIS